MSVFKTFRERHGLTQIQLATGIGLSSQSAISQYEKGERQPELKTAQKFIVFARKHGERYTLEDVYSNGAS